MCLAEYSTLQRMSGTYILVQWRNKEVYNGDDTCDKYNVVKFMSWTNIIMTLFRGRMRNEQTNFTMKPLINDTSR